jgi:hypothetical protein
MTRQIDPETDLALRQREVALVLLAELQFATGTLRLWSGLGPFYWDGVEFTGTGALLSVGTIDEAADLRTSETTFRLSGLDPAIRTVIAADAWQNRPAILWVAVLDSQGQVIGRPVRLRSHRMDTITVAEGQTISVTLTCENGMNGLDRAAPRRYTDQDQQSEYPGDLAFSFVPAVQEFELNWGRADT